MIANVTEALWIDFDLDTAVFLDTIAYWLKKNAANQQPHNFHEGKYWTYNSYPAMAKMFPGWSSKVMRRIIRNCVNSGLLIVGNFNKKSYDNTNWYTLSEVGLSYYPRLAVLLSTTPAQTGSTPAQTGRPIPILQPAILRTNISESKTEPKLSRKATPELRELIDIYREVFPDNPQPHAKTISTSLERTLQTLIKRWPEAEPEGKDFNLEAFRRYLQLLRLTAPKFSLGEYATPNGNLKKNSLETFARWNTFIKFTENAYS